MVSSTSKSLVFAAVVVLSWFTLKVGAETPGEIHYKTADHISYREGAGASDEIKNSCVLDLYYPENRPGFATVVWFHGGGLEEGKRFVPERLKQQGFAVVAVEYRLSPRVHSPVYVQDAAAAVAWTFKQIQEYGGSDKLIFLSGHSAGGYLASMLGLDKRWLAEFNVDANRIAGLIPLSGQAITHFTIRKERGISNTQPIVDDMAPLYHVRKDAPPLLLITGDREKELWGRYEENALLWRMMKVAGHTNTTLYELQGCNHGEMADPGCELLVRFVHKITQAAAPEASQSTAKK